MGAAPRTVKLMYFAWVRERVGTASEEVVLPAGVTTVADLKAWLAARGTGYEAAFVKPGVIRAAIDRRHVQETASIEGAGEIAFFPPVTGG